MARSQYAEAVDDIQRVLRPILARQGFRVRGRTFNRLTTDDLTQVVNLQMGPSDPPGTTYIPGLWENLHGLFTVNLGVYVPEVARYHGGGEAKAWVQDYHCCVRSRLVDEAGSSEGLWWHARADPPIVADVQQRIVESGLPFLEQYGSREQILFAWRNRVANMGASSPPRIVMAIILVARGDKAGARDLLKQQERETLNPGHPEYVRRLAEELGLGRLDA